MSSTSGHDCVTKAQASIRHAEVFVSVYFRHAVSPCSHLLPGHDSAQVGSDTAEMHSQQGTSFTAEEVWKPLDL